MRVGTSHQQEAVQRGSTYGYVAQESKLQDVLVPEGETWYMLW